MPYEIDYVKLVLDSLASNLDKLFLFLVTAQVKIELTENSWLSLWQRLTLELVTLYFMFEKTLD